MMAFCGRSDARWACRRARRSGGGRAGVRSATARYRDGLAGGEGRRWRVRGCGEERPRREGYQGGSLRCRESSEWAQREGTAAIGERSEMCVLRGHGWMAYGACVVGMSVGASLEGVLRRCYIAVGTRCTNVSAEPNESACRACSAKRYQLLCARREGAASRWSSGNTEKVFRAGGMDGSECCDAKTRRRQQEEGQTRDMARVRTAGVGAKR